MPIKVVILVLCKRTLFTVCLKSQGPISSVYAHVQHANEHILHDSTSYISCILAVESFFMQYADGTKAQLKADIKQQMLEDQRGTAQRMLKKQLKAEQKDSAAVWGVRV